MLFVYTCFVPEHGTVTRSVPVCVYHGGGHGGSTSYLPRCSRGLSGCYGHALHGTLLPLLLQVD